MHGILAPEPWISKQEKPEPMFSKHVSKHNKTLQAAYTSENISKLQEWSAKTTSKTQQ